MNNSPIHIVILCSRLNLPGGIERSVVNTANLLARNGHRVTLAILDKSSDSFYPIEPVIKVILQPLSFGITPEGNVITRKLKMIGDVLSLRKLLKGLTPSFVIATEYPFAVAAILCNVKKLSKIISWEHHHFYELKRNYFWNKLFTLTYPRLAAIVCLNEEERGLFKAINKNPVVIPNFIDISEKAELTNKLILTIGRLTLVKGTDLLLQTAKSVLQQHPDWRWKLIGEGDMKEQVLNFIEQESLQQRLVLQAPANHAILSEYQNSSLYVMTSRNECFPMTLLEAQSVGLPCISFDCDTGPRHIIKNSENGLLIEKENTTKLARAISSLISNEILRKKMGERAFTNVKRFSPESIYNLWNNEIFI